MHRRSRGIVAGLALAGGLGVGAGCSARTFRPVSPAVATDVGPPAVEARAETITLRSFPGGGFEAHAGVGIEVAVAAGGQPGLRIADVGLSSPRGRPCSRGAVHPKAVGWQPFGDGASGLLALELARDDVVASGVFEDRAVTLDLALGTTTDGGAPSTRCLRVPLVAAEPTGDAWVHHAFLIGGEERVMAFGTTGSAVRNPGLVLGVGMGAWSGRWRWMIEGEGGFTGREDSLTGATRQGRLFELWGGGVSVSTLVSARGHRGIGVVAGYEALRSSTSGPADSSGTSVGASVLHGPRVGVQLLYLVDPLRWPGFRGPVDAFAAGLSLYVGDWWADARFSHPMPFVGIALEGNLGF